MVIRGYQMITDLTEAQKARFPEYIKKWTDIGLCTEPANRKLAEEGVIESYRIAGKKPPGKIVWCDSPFSQGLTKYIFSEFLKNEDVLKASVKDSVKDSVRDSVWRSVKNSVSDSVWDNVGSIVVNRVRNIVGESVGESVRKSVSDRVWASVGASVGDSVGNIVWESVWNSVKDSVKESVGDSVWKSVGDSLKDSIGNSVYGQHDANWLGFYDYFKEVLGLDNQTKDLSGLWKVAKNAGWWMPYENICWISERHNILRRNERGALHCENGIALAYPDGWGIWALNGVTVPEELVMTPKEKLSIEFFKKETNADIRAEFIRKYGIERMVSLGKIIDTVSDDSGEWHKRSEYSLVDMASVYGVPFAPHLKMKNLTTGIYHLEGVAPNCKTVNDALKFRCGNKNVTIKSIK